MFRKCAGSLFQRVGAADVKDLSPSVFRSRALGWWSSKPPLDLRLYFNTSLTLIRSLMYSGARPWIALKVRISVLKQIWYWTGSHCKEYSTGVTWSYLDDLTTKYIKSFYVGLPSDICKFMQNGKDLKILREQRLSGRAWFSTQKCETWCLNHLQLKAR